MSVFQPFVTWLGDLPLSQAIATSAYLFPGIESVHVLALGLVFGSIAIVDLRLLNIRFRDQTINSLTERVLPFTWIGFVVAVITGLLMFMADPGRYLGNFPFQIKMIVLALAGVNMLVFHFFTQKRLTGWDQAGFTPPAARVAGALSLTFWIVIVVAGRWIGFS